MLLAGRERELRALEAALDSAAESQGGVILLSGESGIGKTRLLGELTVRGENQGFIVVRAASMPQHMRNKELVWQRIWRELSDGATSGHIPFSETPNLQRFNGYPAGTETYSATLFQALADRVLELSREAPVLITVDDVHHADESSLELLRFLAHSLESLPALLALAYSPSAFEHPPAGWIVELIAARARAIEIAPLDEQATGQLLQQLMGSTPDECIIRSVRRLTGGNPRFILGCGSVAEDRDDLLMPHSHKLKIPSTIRIGMKERLKLLSPEAKKMLETAAVFPAAFDVRLMFEVAGLGDAELHAAIIELEGAGLVQPLSDHTYDFVHGFTRELLYRQISVQKRSYLHSCIASVLEIQETEVNGNAYQISKHLLRTGEPQNLERAIHYARLAAKQFAAMREFGKAAEVYLTAIDATEAQAGFDAPTVCDLLIVLGEMQVEARDIDAAQQSLCRAARIAQELDDVERIARIALAMPNGGWPLASVPNGTALMLAQKALAATSESDSIQKALLVARVAGELSYVPDRRVSSAELFNEAVQMALRLPKEDEALIWRVLCLRDQVLRRPHSLQERLDNAEQMIQIAYTSGDNQGLFASAFIMLCALWQRGDATGAEMQIALMDQAAGFLDRAEYRIVLLNVRAAIAFHQGRGGLAEEYCKQARATADLNGLGNFADEYWLTLMLPLREQGRLAELAPLAEATFGTPSYSYASRALSCWFASDLGDVTEAKRQLETLAGESFADLIEGPFPLFGATLLADVCAALNIVKYASRLYDFLLPFQHQTTIFEPAILSFGPVSLYLGKLAAVLSRNDQAIVHLENAVEYSRKSGGRSWMGYCLLELGRSLLVRDNPCDRGKAADILKMAVAAAESLNMTLLGRRVRELLASSFAAFGPSQFGIDDNSSYMAARSLGMSPSRTTARFRRENGGWELMFQGLTVRLKELRGLTLIAHLLARPNAAINTLELAILGKNGESASDRTVQSDLGPILDEEAKRAYRSRIRDLRQELQDARSSGREQVALKLDEELCVLTREIARAVGLFGRDRKNGSDVERARVRVTNSIKFAISKIAERHSALGSHLEGTIKTGGTCCYVPEPSPEILWEL
jgi:type II secretory pathway predicted ATPase ExeA